jgi:hypothetical protein
MEKDLIELTVPRDGYVKDGRLVINAETLRLLQAFGAVYWSTDEIADWFGITDLAWWRGEVSNRGSTIARAIRRGELDQRAKVELRILQGAQAGDEDDIGTYRTMMRDKSFALSKLDLFGGADDAGLWQQIYDYIASGSRGKLSEKERNYLDLLNLIYSLDGRFGKRKVIGFLTSEAFGYTHAQATNLYSEALELFYANRNISRKALKEKTADMYDTLYQAAVAAAKSTADYMLAADILTKKAKMLRLDQEEVPVLDPKMYDRRWTVVSTRPEDIGLPRADRRAVREVVDALLVKAGAPASDRSRVEMEAGLVDLDFARVLENESQEADQH